MIADRLRALRKEHGLSKRALVSKLPLNYSTYANYESGFREPNSEVLQILAKHFGVSLDYLLGVSENRRKADEIAITNEKEDDHIKKYRQLDTHGREVVDIILEKEMERVSFLSTRNDAVKNIDDKWILLKVYTQRVSAELATYLKDVNDYEEMRFVATQVSERADFCVRIESDSMEPKICDGDIVFVKIVPKVEPDNVGIFVYDGETHCKRLRIDHHRGTVTLESLNKAFAPKQIARPENLHTVGLVIGIAE
ncbi:MAG: helix-turn-helix domain-containing protein [Defluviitaleaceae bacterium]|nr:helix-turn-helix domain-containing protein [Defluviitaleaceae bacterium]